MRSKKSPFSLFLAAALALLLALPVGPVARAEALTKPVYAYGESLNKSQIQETARLLGVGNDALTMRVNINELNDLLHDSYDYYQCYSSVYLEPAEQDRGIDVKIATPKTITSITAHQYANAAITAGAVDLKITVASVKAVDGSGALAGVYKAFSGTSGALPEENIKVAQKELDVTSKISKEHEGSKDFSDDQLNAALAEMKGQIAKIKNDNHGTINGDQIGQIINNVMNNYNLNGVLSDQNKKDLQGLMDQFSNIELTQEQKDALAKFGNRLVKEGGKLLDSVKSSWSELSPSVKQEAGGFFSSLFQAIINFFTGLFR